MPGIAALIQKRQVNGGDFWAGADGRWGIGSPFSTLDCGLMLAELGLSPADPVAAGIVATLLRCQTVDGRIRPGPHLAVQPCHTGSALRLLCRWLGGEDPRLAISFEHLLATPATDGGWRCSVLKYGTGPDTDASNPGVTLAVLDAFRFRQDLVDHPVAVGAVDTLLEHWTVRRPLGPCRYGIGSRFLAVEFPFFRYNLFWYVYVLSFYPRARAHPAFGAALSVLRSRLVAGEVVIAHQKPGLKATGLFEVGSPNAEASRRYAELIDNLAPPDALARHRQMPL
ncbi:MAG: prenyltransferase [Devosia sp.]|nr:prenyltransferase [Devosia sp.]